MSLCAFWCYPGIWWSVKYLGEWASLSKMMVLLWVCSWAPPSFRSIEYIECTLLALATTPLQRT